MCYKLLGETIMYHDFAECYREYRLATPMLKIHTEIPLFPNPASDCLNNMMSSQYEWKYLLYEWKYLLYDYKIPWLLIYNNDELYMKYFDTFMNNKYFISLIKYKIPLKRNARHLEQIEYVEYTYYDDDAHRDFFETYTKIVDKYAYPILYSFLTNMYGKRNLYEMMTICLMRLNNYFCHMMWRQYPSYADFVRNYILNKHARIMMICEKCNENFATCDAEYVFADDYIVFNILKFL